MPHVAMPPSTIADAANTNASTTQAFVAQPRERAPHRRVVEAFGFGELRAGASRSRSRSRRSRSPTHTTRHDAPSRSATPVTAAPATHPPLNRPWKRTSRPASSRERVGGDDVHHHVDESARGHRQHERGHEQREVRARPPPTRGTRPSNQDASVNERPAPNLSVMAPPNAATAVAATMPAANSSPRPASVRRNVRSMSTRRDRPRPANDPEHDERDGDRANVVGRGVGTAQFGTRLRDGPPVIRRSACPKRYGTVPR